MNNYLNFKIYTGCREQVTLVTASQVTNGTNAYYNIKLK